MRSISLAPVTTAWMPPRGLVTMLCLLCSEEQEAMKAAANTATPATTPCRRNPIVLYHDFSGPAGTKYHLDMRELQRRLRRPGSTRRCSLLFGSQAPSTTEPGLCAPASRPVGLFGRRKSEGSAARAHRAPAGLGHSRTRARFYRSPQTRGRKRVMAPVASDILSACVGDSTVAWSAATARGSPCQVVAGHSAKKTRPGNPGRVLIKVCAIRRRPRRRPQRHRSADIPCPAPTPSG